MLAIDRTTFLFVCSVREAIPGAHISVSKSNMPHGRSRYVYIRPAPRWRDLKVRISDHAVGMRRATSGEESLFLSHLAKPEHWSVWLSGLAKRAGAVQNLDCGPLFQKNGGSDNAQTADVLDDQGGRRVADLHHRRVHAQTLH